MADDQKRPAPRPRKRAKSDFPFERNNYLLFAVGLVTILVGFIALILGDITLAPILLVVGYCVIIPVAILYSGKKKEDTKPPVEASAGD